MLIEITLLRHERGSEIAHSECLPWECRRVVTIIIMIIILIIIMIIIMITIMSRRGPKGRDRLGAACSATYGS